MTNEVSGKMLRIFVAQTDRWHGRPLPQAILLMLRKEGLAGATIIQGVSGFAPGRPAYRTGPLRLVRDLPVVIEAVDEEERIRKVLPTLDSMIENGLVAVGDVTYLSRRRAARSRTRPSAH